MFFTENHLDEKVYRKYSKETGMFLQRTTWMKKSAGNVQRKPACFYKAAL